MIDHVLDHLLNIEQSSKMCFEDKPACGIKRGRKAVSIQIFMIQPRRQISRLLFGQGIG
jgi:hypothetical protein